MFHCWNVGTRPKESYMDAMSTVPLMGMMTHCAHWLDVIVTVSTDVFSNVTSPSFWTLTPLLLIATAASHVTPLPEEKMNAELWPPFDLNVMRALVVLIVKYLAPARGCLPKESYAGFTSTVPPIGMMTP